MATKFLFEPKIPLWIGEAKEGVGEFVLAKALRSYKMFLARYKWIIAGKDMTKVIEDKLFFKGYVGLYLDRSSKEVYVLDISDCVRDPNNEVVKCSAEGENGYRRTNLEVGKDIVIIYSDITRLPPLLYVWEITNKILERESIISQQDNMLRKPIVLKGSGLEFEELTAKLQNILSGVSFVNTSKNKKEQNALVENGVEVINLQLNNSYKGGELWESRSNFEDLLRDYLGYPSVNNKKRERMITDEVNQSTSIAETNYKDSTFNREQGAKQLTSLFGLEVKLLKMLNWEHKEEEEDNGNRENNADRNIQKA